MIKNFLFVLNRFKTSSVLNILGLSVAFAVFSITMIQAHYDFNYNRNFKQAKDIYQYSNYWKTFDGQMIGISIPLAQLMANQFPEIKAYSVLDANEEKFKLQNDPFSSFKFFLSKANEGFLDVFTPKILSGDARQAFTEQNKVMLTDDVAQLLFGNENPIGQVIVQDTTRYTVVAVCDRFPENCDLKNGIYTTVLGVEDYDKMGWFNYHGYFVVDAKDILSLQEKLNQPGWLGEDDSIDRIELVPLPDIYFTPVEGKEDVGRGSLRTTISLMAIGILILLIAFINFMNFSVAMIPSRVRGVNIQKILGVNPQQLKYIIASEAVCFAFLSFLISLLLISLFKNTDLNTFFSADLSLEKNIPLLVFISLTGILLGILFGIYPARRVTSYQPAMALSGSFAQSKRSSFLRNVLITLQFFFAITLIVVAFFIKIQHNYMINRSWGFQKENVVYLPIKTEDIDVATFENELRQNPDILNCTLSASLPGQIGQNWGMEIGEKEIFFTTWIVRSDFLDFFGIPVIEGRDFTPSDDGKSRVICNQALLQKFELAQIIGAKMGGGRYEIVGVIGDINFESLHSGIRPLCFITQNLEYHYKYGVWLFIKIAGNNTQQTMDAIKTTWNKLSDEPIDLNFLDATLNSLYKNESNLAKLISIFGLIAVIIAVMGVYGLIVFNARYKQKEIAIRKVNGSTIKEIMLMLNKNVLLQLGIAFVPAVPAAYFVVNKWLENFAYKTPVYAWVFLLGGAIVLLITLLTVSAQSYKAARRNPTKALNSE